MNQEHNPEAEFHYFSNEGDPVYVPVKSDTSILGVLTSIDDTRLPRARNRAANTTRSSSLPPIVTPDEPHLIRQVTIPATDNDEVERLGLPENWVIYPLFETEPRDEPEQTKPSVPPNLDGNESEGTSDDGSSRHDYATSFDPIDNKSIDFSKPLAFAIATQNVDLPPEYASRQPSIATPPDEKDEPPSYFSHFNSNESTTKPPLYQHQNHSNKSLHSLFHKEKHSKDSLHSINEEPPQSHFHPNRPPHLKPARPLPRDDFSPSELEDLRRTTRHHIRVVTRNSVGLTATLALSGVAPQLLIAAAINAYCLGRGAYNLHKHLEYLRWNNIHVRKRDVVIAVTEGVAVKLAFLAITVNHCDFIVLARETLGQHASAVLDLIQNSSGVPGPFHVLNEWFIKPAEVLQQHLGLATMSEQAMFGSAFAPGTWTSTGGEVLKNMFFVGAIQGGMEQLVDEIQERLCKATGKVATFVQPRAGPAPWAKVGLGLDGARGFMRRLSGLGDKEGVGVKERHGSAWGLGGRKVARDGRSAGAFRPKGSEMGKAEVVEGVVEGREMVIETIKIEGVLDEVGLQKVVAKKTFAAEKAGGGHTD